MKATDHLNIIYDRISELEDAGEPYGLTVIALTADREIPITEKFSGLEKLKKAIKKSKDIEARGVRVEHYGTPDRRSKLVKEDLVAFSNDFLMPEPSKKEDASPVNQHQTFIDNPEKLKALNTLGGIEGVLGISTQLSQKDNEITMLKLTHRYELNDAKREADQLRDKVIHQMEEIDQLKKQLDEADGHKKELEKKSEELSGIEQRLAPREMLNNIGAQILTNLATKMIEKNPKIAGLMGLEDDPSGAPEFEKAGSDSPGEVTYEKDNSIENTVNEIAAAIKQFDPVYIKQIIEILQFVRDVPERHALILNTIQSYYNQLNQHNHDNIDSEN
jgi:hypothetical protein